MDRYPSMTQPVVPVRDLYPEVREVLTAIDNFNAAFDSVMRAMSDMQNMRHTVQEQVMDAEKRLTTLINSIAASQANKLVVNSGPVQYNPAPRS